MNLREQLDDYEVTAVPAPAPLALVWSEVVEADGSDDDGADQEPIAVLADYRITRIPGSRAS